ncbi:MAG: cation diffusion facilitator family transporter, partial [Clostridiales bacterium]|nr:cation diffusion facilitator family transporter [Clostridiales bacterium]
MESLNEAKNIGSRQGKIVSAIGIALNLVLAVFKIALGAVTSLISLVADGLNNLSDCGSGAVSLVSFRISQKPADKEHPYGHQRAEYVASMIISFLVLLLAVELFRESLDSVLAKGSSQGNVFVYVLLGVSVAVKAGMFVGYGMTAKKIHSDVLKAAAIDSACDCLATVAVAVGLVLAHFGIAADGYAGLVVSLFVAWEGVSILREAGSQLLGRAPDPALVDKIRSIILNQEGVLGVHDLRVYQFGRARYYASAHIEADASLPSAVTHECIDRAE